MADLLLTHMPRREIFLGEVETKILLKLHVGSSIFLEPSVQRAAREPERLRC